MEARIESLMGVIKKKLIEEIIKYGPNSRQEAAYAAGVRQQPPQVSPKQDISVKESLRDIKQEIKRINASLRTIEQRQNRIDNQQSQYQSQNRQPDQKRRNSENFHYSTVSQIKTFRLPSHLDDHQVREALYNPELAQSTCVRREKRKSRYDEVYEQSERRIEDLARSVATRRGKSKISQLIERDRQLSKSRTQKNHSESQSEN